MLYAEGVEWRIRLGEKRINGSGISSLDERVLERIEKQTSILDSIVELEQRTGRKAVVVVGLMGISVSWENLYEADG